MRVLLLLLGAAALAPAPVIPQTAREYVQAVEFPYYLYPCSLWERELVWLKTIGIRTVEFSVPWNWHQVDVRAPDFTGSTSPRRDLVGFIRLLRRLQMRAWIRPQPPVRGWSNGGYPDWAAQDRRAVRVWLRELEKVLEPQTEKHGGPIAFVEGGGGVFDVPPPPQPVVTVSANDAGALVRSRQALASARGSLLWEEVEDALYPGGWEAAGAPVFRKGAVSLNGDERPTVTALRRSAALLKNWAGLLSRMRAQAAPAVQPLSGKFPRGVRAVELLPSAPRIGAAVSLVNQGDQTFRGELRVWDPEAQRRIAIPAVEIAPGGALWLPVGLSLAAGGLCRDCSAFAGAEHIVYATVELQAVEFENGILAMEFAAPVAGEVVLQLARQPCGPFLAAGRPTKFDWDEKTQRARLPVPAGQGPAHRVRIGLAIEPPETSAFFGDPKRLIIGRKNVVSTSYSSEQLAARSRLRLPEAFTARPAPKSPTEIEYEIDVPAEALHGDWANLAIEADGVLLGRARLQLFRPVSVRSSEAIPLHFGTETALPVEPPLIPIDAQAGRNLDLTIRNNSPQIQTYTIEAGGKGWKFFPARSEMSIGAVMERTMQLRVFPEEAAGGITDWRLRVSGGALVEMPMRFVAIPRGHSVAYSADLDGDGAPEWVLENQQARAVFSGQDGGRWMEFVWKPSGLNVLPENGALTGSGPVAVQVADGALEFVNKNWTRRVRLAGPEAQLTFEQNAPLPPETLAAGKKGEVLFTVTRESANRAVYALVR